MSIQLRPQSQATGTAAISARNGTMTNSLTTAFRPSGRGGRSIGCAPEPTGGSPGVVAEVMTV